MMIPGERIKILRVLSGLTQEQLADKTKINRASLSSWEKGSYNPSAPGAEAISKHLQCQPSYILFGSPTLNTGIWQPQPPKAKRYTKNYHTEFESLFKDFCAENTINHYAIHHAENGKLIFLGQAKEPLRHLLLLTKDFDLSHLSFLNLLSKTEFTFGSFSPPMRLIFLESATLQDISTYTRLARSNQLEIDQETIKQSFLRLMKLRGISNDEDRDVLNFSAFMHIKKILAEFDEPQGPPQVLSMSPLDTTDGLLSNYFSIILREVEARSLIWSGELDSELSEKIRSYLIHNGFTKKMAE